MSVRSSTGVLGKGTPRVPPGAGGSGGGGGLVRDFSVNAAAVDGRYPDGSIVLRTGSRTNAAGAYNGGGAGNKSIFGAFGFSGLPIASLLSLSYTWTNVLGPGGPFFIPPGGPTVTTPYVNLIVDFGAGDLRVLALCDDSLAPAITASIGTYFNDGFNVMTFSWDSSKNVLIVNAPPNPTPGGVVPDVSVGALWPENSYKWSDLIVANPAAVLVDAFPANPVLFPAGDGGMPVGAVLPSVLLVSGDSANLTKSGKRVSAFIVNGVSVL